MPEYLERGIKERVKYLSVCSGIEAATVAWEPLGWRAVAFAEVEKFPSALLAYHYPDVPNLGDMTQINGADYRGKIDVLVGGTPCQSFSVAGLRRGFEDDRGNLTLEFVRIANESEPAFVVWENVPGVLSDRGNAFGCFLAALAGEDAPLVPPRGKWTDAGYVLGPQRAICWRILDAQYFGLAQRRRRVFLVGCPSDGADPRAILFEFEGLRRDTPPSRKTQTAVAEAITRSAYSGGLGGRPEGAAAGHFISHNDIAGSLSARYGRNGGAANGDLTGHRLVIQALTGRLGGGGPDDNKAQGGFYVAAFGGGNCSGDLKVTATLSAHGRRQDFEVETFVAYPLRAQSQIAHDESLETYVVHSLRAESTVRRLLPLECERLQGFPENYTGIPFRGKPAADAPRYRALGNSMAINVMHWIGERIERHA